MSAALSAVHGTVFYDHFSLKQFLLFDIHMAVIYVRIILKWILKELGMELRKRLN